MKYLDAKFGTPANSRAFVEGWERCFGEGIDELEQPDPGATPTAITPPGDSVIVEKLRE